jgi:acyl-CoA dehydrogenase
VTESLDVLASVRSFISDLAYPAEALLAAGGPPATARLTELQRCARERGLWALPLPATLGGRGLGLSRYAPVAEVEGSSDYGPTILGSDLLLDAMMLDQHGSAAVRERFLQPMVAGNARPSFGMTEPDVSGSDPAGLRTVAEPDGSDWVIRGRKWFTSGAADAAFTTVVCRTEGTGVPAWQAFSLLVVPTDAPGYHIVRDLPVLGVRGGHCEIALKDVRVPGEHLLGMRGGGLGVVGQRLTEDTPLGRLHRTARSARILDGPDEVHVQSVARRLLRRHQGVSSTRPDSTASIAPRK